MNIITEFNLSWFSAWPLATEPHRLPLPEKPLIHAQVCASSSLGIALLQCSAPEAVQGCVPVCSKGKIAEITLVYLQNHSKPIFISDIVLVYVRAAMHQRQELIASAYSRRYSNHPYNSPTVYRTPSKLYFVGGLKTAEIPGIIAVPHNSAIPIRGCNNSYCP